MSQNAKPLLILFTDASTSLLGRPLSGRLDPLVHKLHLTDLKIITVDLADENSLTKKLGLVHHEEHLKYLAYITRGAHFTYDQLIKLAG